MNIKDILTATPQSLLKVAAFLKDSKTTIYEDSDMYIYVDRQAPITLVSHVDTVRGKDKLTLKEKHGIVWNSSGVLGADDRAGVYAMFRLSNLNCNLLFTNYEECGGKGAKLASKALNQHMVDSGVKLLIELDRSGVSEYVYYSYHLPKQIKAYVESYGFNEEYGSYSDISEFDTIPAVNLSVGYYNQHTSGEYLVMDELELTIQRVKRMLQAPPTKLYKVVEPIFTAKDTLPKYGYDHDYGDYYSTRKDTKRDDIPQSVDEFFREPVKWTKGGK